MYHTVGRATMHPVDRTARITPAWSDCPKDLGPNRRRVMTQSVVKIHCRPEAKTTAHAAPIMPSP